MTIPTNSKKVLVTGGSGFIALHIIHQLLVKGHIVHTTTRSLTSSRSDTLKTLKSKYGDRLELFEADLLVTNSFLAAMTGVDVVVHVATPINHAPKDPYQDMVKPAVEGTRNVLDTCLLCDSVKTLVVTSSLGAVCGVYPKATKVYNTEDFNDVTLEDSPYSYSKVQAEKLVWEFSKKYEDRFRVVTVAPTFVIGPYLPEVLGNSGKFSILDSDKDNIGLQIIKIWLKGGTQALPKYGGNLIDVRDVALAHVNAIEFTNVTGRFLLIAAPYNWDQFKEQIVKFTGVKLEDLVPDQTVKGNGIIPKVDTTPAKEVLKINFIQPEQSLKDTFNQLLEFQ